MTGSESCREGFTNLTIVLYFVLLGLDFMAVLLSNFHGFGIPNMYMKRLN